MVTRAIDPHSVVANSIRAFNLFCTCSQRRLMSVMLKHSADALTARCAEHASLNLKTKQMEFA